MTLNNAEFRECMRACILISLVEIIIYILVLLIAIVVCTTARKISTITITEDGVNIVETKDNISVENKEHEYAIVNVSFNGKDMRYNCYIEQDNCEHVIKPTFGEGEYMIRVYSKDGEDVKLEAVIYKDITKDIKYVGSSYNVEIDKFRDSIDEVIKANEWNSETDLKAVWNYFHNYKYDYDIEKKINNGEISVFIPDLNKLNESKSGICYDISSMITCICRELYGEARLCVGYVDGNHSEYHAWCEVNTKEGWVNMDTIRRNSIGYCKDITEYEVLQTY